MVRRWPENWEKYALIASDRFSFDDVDDVDEALIPASTPGTADKVMATFD